MRVVGEEEFRRELHQSLRLADWEAIGSVTGPGRSGAVAAVYASHMLGVPFIPYGQKPPIDLGRLLIVDTATESGKTLRKATAKYEKMGATPITLAVFNEKDPLIGRVAFWYEATKPQRYKHERGRSDMRDL